MRVIIKIYQALVSMKCNYGNETLVQFGR